MKKTIMILTLALTLLLSACQTNQVQCGEGLVLENGVCVIDDGVDDTPDPVSDTCEVSFNDYGVSNYEMVWNDEFEYNGSLDSTKWEYQIGNGGAYGIPGWGNNELQYYTNSTNNVAVQNGVLRITASTVNYAQYEYTSGRVRTKDLGDFKYGIIEVCAKLPTTLGTWPAIWMLPTDSPYGGWPTGGEIDIMEAVGYETDTIHFNIHTENNNWGSGQSVGSSSTISNIDSVYHAYAIKWTETDIIFYVDGIEHFSYNPNNLSYQDWPFDTEFHLILNIAVGGSWGGGRGIEDGSWQDSMFIDYVRVYQEEN